MQKSLQMNWQLQLWHRNRREIVEALRRRGTASAWRLSKDLWESPSLRPDRHVVKACHAGLVTRILRRLERESIVESFYVGPIVFWRLR
jgi:hypothetical protein